MTDNVCDCEGPRKMGPGWHAPYCQIEKWRNRDSSGRRAYAKHVDSSGMHCNRFPSWRELTDAEREEWDKKAAPTSGDGHGY